MSDTANTNTQKILPEVGARDIPHDDLGWQEVRDLGPVSYTHLTLPTNREV